MEIPCGDASFDAVSISFGLRNCADPEKVLLEIKRVLKPGGTLMLSDVFFEAPASVAEAAGFELLQLEDMTGTWQEYYLEALWREEDCGCEIPRGKCGYWLMISRKV